MYDRSPYAQAALRDIAASDQDAAMRAAAQTALAQSHSP